jgi:hypothetical protein
VRFRPVLRRLGRRWHGHRQLLLHRLRLRQAHRHCRGSRAVVVHRPLAAEQQPQQPRGAGLVEGPVAVAALGRLDAARAAVFAFATLEQVDDFVQQLW